MQKKKRKPKKELMRGIISITGSGKGFFESLVHDEDIIIASEYLNTALNGDTVEILLLSPTLKKDNKKRIAGKVVRVIERAKKQFVGVLEKKDKLWFLVPDDHKMYIDINIIHQQTEGKLSKLKQGDKALVEFTEWHNPNKNPRGKILKILGPKGKHEVEMAAIVLEQGFETSFSEQIENEAVRIKKQKYISEQEIIKRKDFRKITTFTIDPYDAKDFDDALSVKELPNKDIEVGIHIADVSHYVLFGDLLDKEARHRGTSIYLVDRTIPMLPEVLSNDICSLNENEDKLTFSAVFVLSQKGEIKKRWFGKTIINSNKRFTYEKAQQILDVKNGDFYKELSTLNQLANIIRKKRFKEGSIVFEQDEVVFELDKNGKPLKITKKKRLQTHLLIEDFMLLANKEIAEYFYRLSKKTKRKDMLFIYRIHEMPNEEKLEELSIFLRAIGYAFETTNGKISGKDINKLFERIKGKPEENLIKVATIRSMAKAIYTTKNIGHFGLAFKYYTHFTSPIRRYPDIMVHRILQSHLDGTYIKEAELKQYEKLALQSSRREVAATIAERESIKYKQVEYMQEHIGEIFDGVITGVTNWGIYVEEKNTQAEGLVRMSSLSDDYYVFNKKKYSVVGTRTKKIYRLGDKVTVKLKNANTETKTLEYVFV